MLFLVLCWGLGREAEGADVRSESEVKALFFVTIARYAEWPPAALGSEGTPFVIGVLGRDPFGSLLDSLTRNEQIRGHPIRVVRFASADSIRDCHLLFFGEMSSVRLELELSRLKGRSVLTVSDQSNFALKGGMIEMYVNDERKVRLRVSKTALAQAGLSISPTLMRLSDVVASIEWLTPPNATPSMGSGETSMRPFVALAALRLQTAN